MSRRGRPPPSPPAQVLAAFSANVWDVKVVLGQDVEAGDTLVVLEVGWVAGWVGAWVG